MSGTTPHHRWMARCLQLARNGAGRTTPNPLVGAVLVQGDKLLAEGWHKELGAPHAEADCLAAFGDGPIPPDAILYVSLEPCAHHGRTPPCADLLIARGVQHVVVGCADPNPLVAGQGIARLRAAGVRVDEHVAEDECRWTNRRFLTAFEQQRPYIILKWARTTDGFLDQHPRAGIGVQRISAPATNVLVHRWRSEEQAILVGADTVINDDPALTVRHVEGRQPMRVVIDRRGRTPARARVYDDEAMTLLATNAYRADIHTEQLLVPSYKQVIPLLLAELYRRKVRSLLVEGGARTLQGFIDGGHWDEARVITAPLTFGAGTPAPVLPGAPLRSFASDVDRVDLYSHHVQPPDAWAW